jgi:hypothetical protein
MSKITKLLVVPMIAASFAAPTQVSANQLNNVSCSIIVDVTKPGGTEAYEKNFVIQQGADFFDDFSTATRIKEFSASTLTTSGKTNVTINYFNDVGVFDALEFSTTYTLPRGQEAGSVSGRSAAYTSNGNFTADYTLTCKQAKL